jgi:hypothetical protein
VLNETELLNPRAARAWSRLVDKYPEWSTHFGTCGRDDLEVAIPAPSGSNAGHLIVFTNGVDLWLRYSHPRMCYLVDDEDEMLSIVEWLLRDEVLFVVIMSGDEWAETTLIRPGQEPNLEVSQIAQVVSWSGRYDRTVVVT